MVRLLLTVALVAATMAVSPAHAKDMNGKFGVGLTQTLGGVSGLGLRYFGTRRLAFEVDFGVSFIDRDNERASTEVLFAAGVFYALVQHRYANLMLGIRGDVGLLTTPPNSSQTVTVSEAIATQTKSTTTEVDSAALQFNIEIPLIVEYFFSDSFAINLAVGLVIIFVPKDGAILETSGPGAVVEAGDIGFGLGAGGLLGSAGFTFYF